jgi:hypothetical protein
MTSSDLHKPPLKGDHVSGVITEILQSVAARVEQTSHRQWQFRIPGTRCNGRLCLSSGWCSFSLPLQAVPGAIDSELIESSFKQNVRLNGSSRIILSPTWRERQLVIEIAEDLLPFDYISELERLIATQIASLGGARSRKHSQAIGSLRKSQMSHPQLESIFEESSWPLRKIDDCTIEVPLEIPGSYYAASISQDPGGLRLSVPIFLNEFAAASPAGRSAVCALLWATASRVRMVKPVLARKRLGIEVSLPYELDMARSVAHGCAVLAVTLQHIVDEAELLLANEHLAQLYLSFSGFQKTA